MSVNAIACIRTELHQQSGLPPLLAVAHGNGISIIALDYSSSTVRLPPVPMFLLEESGDDVNDAAVHRTMGTSTHSHVLAAAGDSGTVHIGWFSFHSRSCRWSRVRPKHGNLVHSLCFASNSSRRLITGAFDCLVALVDTKRCRRMQSHRISELHFSGQTSIINPPFVHATDCSTTGRLVATACGDGCVRLFLTHEHGDSIHIYCSFPAHNAPATNIKLLREGVVTAATDCTAKVFQLDMMEASESYSPTVRLQQSICLDDKPNAITLLSSAEHPKLTLLVATVSGLVSRSLDVG